MKIVFFIGSRANYGRLKAVMRECRKNHTVQFIAACSAYNMPFDVEPDFRIQALLSGDDTEAMALTAGLLLCKVTDALKILKPDMVFVHGDRYEVLACAMAASYMNIPLCHSEGGEDTGTIDNKVRYAISALADIHFPVSVYAKVRLQKMGYTNVHRVGSTALDNLVGIDLSNNRTEPYIVVLHHPNTTDPEDITELVKALNEANIHKVWVNPNVDAGSKNLLKLIHRLDVEFVKDLPPEEYARLLKNCKCAVGNSSSFIKEGAYFGTPAVIVGDRQHNREHGQNVKFCTYNAKTIKELILFQMDQKYEPDYRFGDGSASKKITEVLDVYYRTNSLQVRQ